MKERIRVYVAGPISKGDLQANIDQAREAGRKLITCGFAPMVPQLTCFMDGNEPTVTGGGFEHAEWLAVDLAWVAVADALLRLPGESKGADMEVEFATQLGIPVYFSVEDLLANPPARGHAGFHSLLRHMGQLHDKKQADYGRAHDPFANVRASEEIGIPAWKGAWLRARDKVKRVDTYCVKGTLANEGVEDSWLDLAVYCLICLILFKEYTAKPG